MNILIVSITQKEEYYDGFFSAVSILKHKYNVDFWKVNFDKNKREYSKYDLVMFKGNFGVDYASTIGFVKDTTGKQKVGLFISSTGRAKAHELKFYDLLFYETRWYYNSDPLLKYHKNCYHGFGIDTNIMKPQENPNKIYDVISIGTFAQYKRQHLITKFEGKKAVYGNKYGNDNNPIVKYLENNGVEVFDAIPYQDLCNVYNSSKMCYVPCTVDGGGDRCVLEARACGINVQIEPDNPKLQELYECKIFNHIEYSEMIENGIKKLFNITDNTLKNDWFIAFKKNDKSELYNFTDYEKILYRDLTIDGVKYDTTYIADPFIVKEKDDTYLFVEYKNTYGKGCLGCINITTEPTKIRTIIPTTYHMSFPFIFKNNDTYYLLPETSENNTLELYKSKNFPYEWELENTMIKNINLSDTVVLQHDNMIWLFTTENYNNNAITIYYSDNLFSNEWKKHPVMNGTIKSCRCAGNIFIQNNRMFRPAQNCEKGYGYSLVMYEINKLTTSEYQEEIVEEIFPNWFPNIYGTHTFNFNDEYIVWDGKFKRVTHI